MNVCIGHLYDLLLKIEIKAGEKEKKGSITV